MIVYIHILYYVHIMLIMYEWNVHSPPFTFTNMQFHFWFIIHRIVTFNEIDEAQQNYFNFNPSKFYVQIG